MKARIAAALILVAGLVFLAWFWATVAAHLAGFFGFGNGGGNYSHYLFWSGAGSDLGELTIILGIAAVLRRHNCEVHGCWRIGQHTTAAGHMVCRKHHPDGHLTVEQVREAHHLYLGKQPGRG